MWTLLITVVAMGTATAPTPALKMFSLNFASQTLCNTAKAFYQAPGAPIVFEPVISPNNVHVNAGCFQVQ